MSDARPLRIAIVVHGRFHAFDLARALHGLGHEVAVFTNYPRGIARRRFGLTCPVESFLAHGVATRAVRRLGAARWTEPLELRAFGAWAARSLAGRPWDLVYAFSGVAEELLRDPRVQGLRAVMRGSAHIDAQAELLEVEGRRAGVPIDRPSAWVRAREQREYALADRIVVLSRFAARTFEERGLGARLWLHPLGANLHAFGLPTEALEARAARVRRGEPVRVLYVGLLSARKGLVDLLEASRALPADRFTLRAVGGALPEAEALLAREAHRLELVGHRPQAELLAHYAWADVFLFPTIEDGFAVVLAQARRAGLPVIATTHCAAPELVDEGRTGFFVPVRAAGRVVEHLRGLDADRPRFEAMVREAARTAEGRTWDDTARDLVALVHGAQRGTA